MLTLLGLGLIFVSVTAFRNVNETPSDATDRAFFNAVEKTASQLLKLVFLPLDFLIACKDALVSIILFPFRMISSSTSRAGKLGQKLLGAAQDWFIWLLYLPVQFLSSLLCSSEKILKTSFANLTDQLTILWSVLDFSVVGNLFQRFEFRIPGSVHRAKIQWIILNHQVSDKILLIENFGIRIAQELLARRSTISDRISDKISEFVISGPMHRAKFRWTILNCQVSDYVFSAQKFGERMMQELLTTWDRVFDTVTKEHGRFAKFSISLQQKGNKYAAIVSTEYHSLNRVLAAYAILVEEWIRSISGIHFGSR